jgi:hypothetical protein
VAGGWKADDSPLNETGNSVHATTLPSAGFLRLDGALAPAGPTAWQGFFERLGLEAGTDFTKKYRPLRPPRRRSCERIGIRMLDWVGSAVLGNGEMDSQLAVRFQQRNGQWQAHFQQGIFTTRGRHLNMSKRAYGRTGRPAPIVGVWSGYPPCRASRPARVCISAISVESLSPFASAPRRAWLRTRRRDSASRGELVAVVAGLGGKRTLFSEARIIRDSPVAASRGAPSFQSVGRPPSSSQVLQY